MPTDGEDHPWIDERLWINLRKYMDEPAIPTEPSLLHSVPWSDQASDPIKDMNDMAAMMRKSSPLTRLTLEHAKNQAQMAPMFPQTMMVSPKMYGRIETMYRYTTEYTKMRLAWPPMVVSPLGKRIDDQILESRRALNRLKRRLRNHWRVRKFGLDLSHRRVWREDIDVYEDGEWD